MQEMKNYRQLRANRMVTHEKFSFGALFYGKETGRARPLHEDDDTQQLHRAVAREAGGQDQRDGALRARGHQPRHLLRPLRRPLRPPAQHRGRDTERPLALAGAGHRRAGRRRPGRDADADHRVHRRERGRLLGTALQQRGRRLPGQGGGRRGAALPRQLPPRGQPRGGGVFLHLCRRRLRGDAEKMARRGDDGAAGQAGQHDGALHGARRRRGGARWRARPPASAWPGRWRS